MTKRTYSIYSRFCFAAMAITLFAGLSTQAQTAGSAALADGVEVHADRLEYDGDHQLLIGTGNAVVEMEEQRLTADYIQVHTETLDATARGNVMLSKDGTTWQGEELNYNIRSGEGDYGTFRGQRGKFYMEADESKLTEGGDYQFRGLMLTTCDPDNREFWMKARRADLIEDRLIKARHIWFHLGPLPIFYLPYYERSLERGEHDLDVLPGYSSEWGAYVRGAYSLYFGESLRATTHLDLFADRGVGVGENLFWHKQDRSAHGKLKTYFIDDSEPLRNEEEIEEYGGSVDHSRYRIRFQHTHALSSRDLLLADVHYLSDPKILDDFFEDEFKQRRQPENRVSLTHRGDMFSAGLMLNKRLNDFYENVDRKPELSLDFWGQPIGESGWYYEGGNELAFLERLYSEDTNFPDRVAEEDLRESYSALRMDTLHRLYYPRKYFRFLNVIPSFSWRGTYYSDHVEEQSRNEVVSSTDSNGVVTVSTNSVLDRIEQGSAMRSVFEFSLENSFKAFKVLEEGPTIWGLGMRHVVEPYLLYTFRPEPNFTADELYQFDRIDEIGERHSLTPGIRNKWQTRRRGGLRDVLDVNVFADYRLDADDDEQEWGPLTLDADFLPVDHVSLEFEADYDFDESSVTDFDAILRTRASDDSVFYVDYSYRQDRKNMVIAGLTLFPDDKFSLGAYARYEIDESRLEETTWYIRHGLDCIGFEAGVKSRPGYDGKEDEHQIWVQMFLRAFPESAVRMIDVETR